LSSLTNLSSFKHCHNALLRMCAFCRLKPIYFWGPKNQSFRNNSDKAGRSGPNSVYVDRSRGDNVQGISGAIGLFWAKWGLGRVPRSPSFFCAVIQTTFRQLRNGRFSQNLVTKRTSVSRREIPKDIFGKFSL